MLNSKQTEELNLVLDAATRCIERNTLMDFTMSAVSKEAGISMGSIYKHIQTKEDLILALAWRASVGMLKVFEDIFALPLPISCRMIALSLTDPEHITCDDFDSGFQLAVLDEAILSRASESWREKLYKAEKALESTVNSNIRASLNAQLPQLSDIEKAEFAEEVMVATWSMHVGYGAVVRQRSHYRDEIEVSCYQSRIELDNPIIKSQIRMLNTYDWEKIDLEDLQETCAQLEKMGLR